MDVCKCAATRLEVPWPATTSETLKSRYAGKTYLLPTSAVKQPLPVFPELLEELTRSWKDRPCSGRSLDCEGMESLMPPMEPHVATHLHPKQFVLSSGNPALPTKVNCFQSALTARAYRAVALNTGALNVLSLLSAYQTELCGDFAQPQNPAVFADIPDLCLRIQRCAVQALGKPLQPVCRHGAPLPMAQPHTVPRKFFTPPRPLISAFRSW